MDSDYLHAMITYQYLNSHKIQERRLKSLNLDSEVLEGASVKGRHGTSLNGFSNS